MPTRSDKRKFHYIYKITRTDGKYYIGLHSTDDLEDGYFGSGHLLARSIRAHGKEVHTKEILEFLPSREELRNRERALVSEETLNDPLCMNLQLGGGGGFCNEEHRRKFINSPRATKFRGTERARDISRRALQKTWENPSAKLLAAVKVNLQKACAVAAGEESNAKRKLTMKANGHSQGEKNSQFGTCWVTRDGKNFKIKKDNLDQYLAEGFIRGRKQTRST